MDLSRRRFLAGAAAGVVGLPVAALAGEKGGAEASPKMVGACGLACAVCPLMKAGKCKGCASGTEASAEMVEKKACPVLKCAAMKKLDYCGTGCKMFTKCQKLVGRPYAESFLGMIDKRLGETA
jgi:hypothetical protein